MGPIPARFSRTILGLFGERGRAWLAGLPALLAACERRWSLRVLEPFALSYNYVAPALRSDESEVVLKLGVPHSELLSEMEALRLYAGRGAVRLLEADAEQGILLLERLQPGVMLAERIDRSTGESDEEATAIAAQVMAQLWRPVPAEHRFPTVAAWAGGLERLRLRYQGGTGPLPVSLVERAERRFAELLASTDETMLLHGDLHHYNILQAGEGRWLAIDPKGLVGERAYEAGALLLNPDVNAWPDLDRRLARRLDGLAEMLGLERARLANYGAAFAVLSAWWSLEDHGSGWEETIALAERLDRLAVG